MSSEKGKVVFVVHDEVVIAKSLAILLRNAGFEATAFHSPEHVLKKAKETVPNLLISDVVMPGMTGIELAIEMKSRYPQCKILLFSGQSATADLLRSAREEGHDFECLLKPVHPTELLAKILM
jgi:FixJ family two-component response regulator